MRYIGSHNCVCACVCSSEAAISMNSSMVVFSSYINVDMYSSMVLFMILATQRKTQERNRR